MKGDSECKDLTGLVPNKTTGQKGMVSAYVIGNQHKKMPRSNIGISMIQIRRYLNRPILSWAFTYREKQFIYLHKGHALSDSLVLINCVCFSRFYEIFCDANEHLSQWWSTFQITVLLWYHMMSYWFYSPAKMSIYILKRAASVVERVINFQVDKHGIDYTNIHPGWTTIYELRNKIACNIFRQKPINW